MTSLLGVRGFVFDTKALNAAYAALPPSSRVDTTGYDEQALRRLVRYFADWSPVRSRSLNSAPEEQLDELSADERRELYDTLIERLAENLRDQYRREDALDGFEGFVHRLGRSPLPDAIHTFFLRYLWNFSEQLHDYNQDLLPDSDSTIPPEEIGDEPPQPAFFSAIRRLPSSYLDVKAAQYEGDDKINAIRYDAIQSIRSPEGLQVDELQELQREENERHETDIMRAYDEFTTVGQLYYDYFKPRFDAILKATTDGLIDRLDLADSDTHHVSFIEPRNRLGSTTWFSIFPSEIGDKTQAWQLHFAIKWDHTYYGLYPGDELQDDADDDLIDLEHITETDALTIEGVAEKFEAVSAEYLRLNDLEDPEPPTRPPDWITETVPRQLERANQVIFYGPPGTGKTYHAQRFAEWWVNDQSPGQSRPAQVEAVTFHPSMSYEDFLEGLTAEATDAGSVEYHVEDGILKRVAANAQQAYDRYENGNDSGGPPPYVLIIDEINRGNLAQIFGETITLLEADKRGSYEVSLAHSDEQFTLPPNLYVIGTMNTADRSIALVDAALRRRFRFVQFPPDIDALTKHYGFDDHGELHRAANGDDTAFRRLIALSILGLDRLNELILDAPDLGKGQQVGHSYFFDLDDVQGVLDAWQYDVLPLLEEYYFGQFDRIRRQLFDGAGEEVIDWDRERIRDFDDVELATFLAEYVGLEDGFTYTESALNSGATESTNRDPSPTFPEFLATVGDRVYDAVGETLNADRVDDFRRDEDLDRLTLAVKSNDPDHPSDEHVRYRYQIRPHLDSPVIDMNVYLSNSVREAVGEDLESFVDDLNFPFDIDVEMHRTFRAISTEHPIDVEGKDPYALDGDELRETVGEDIVDETIDAFCEMIEQLHSFFVGMDAEVDDVGG